MRSTSRSLESSRFPGESSSGGLKEKIVTLGAGLNGTFLLRAGRPPTLQASDCELVRQIKETLLAELPVRVRSYRFTCEVPRAEAGQYRL